MTLQDCLQKITKTAELKEGWDSYKARPINQLARDNATSFCEFCFAFGLIPRRVAPSCVGAVAFVFGDGREAVIEFYNRGDACCLFSDDETEEMETQMVEINQTAFHELLVKIKSYLEAK